jgi:hypothetical protein
MRPRQAIEGNKCISSGAKITKFQEYGEEISIFL